MSQITKNALGNSLKLLLQKKPLSKITVRDIVEDCGVNRQTFYYHFQDIYDLLEWMFSQDIDKFFLGQSDNLKWRDWCDILINYMKENKKLILNVYNSVSHEKLENHLKVWIKPSIAKLVEKFSEGKNYSEENKTFVENIYAITLEGILMQWIESGMAEEKLENIGKLFTVMDGSISIMLEKLE